MTISLKIDNREVEVAEGATIMEAADVAGVRIPRFCHHPKLSTSANCRICAVEIKGRDGLAMSCKETALDGMEVMTDTIAVEVAREDVLEFMLANHPIDCPICDRPGECSRTYTSSTRAGARASPKGRSKSPRRWWRGRT